MLSRFAFPHFLISSTLTLGLLGCSPVDRGGAATLEPLSESRPVRVTTTVNMITDLVQQVGGDRVQVSGLMGAGVDPHYYKASAGDVRRLVGADVVFYGGLHLEGKMVELFERSRNAVALSEAFPQNRLISPDPSRPLEHDPHVWFDVSLWQLTVDRVRDALSQLDPAGATVYARNAGRYRAQLERLDGWVQRKISSIPPAQRVMITAHDAFNYFSKRYGIEVRGLQGISTTAEAGVKDVQELAEFIERRGIKAIFVESSVPHRTVDAVVQAVRSRGDELRVGGELYSDSAGPAGTPQGTYIGMVEANVNTLVGALR